MAHKAIVAAFLIAAGSPALAALPSPSHEPLPPAGDAMTLYCLRMEPITGSRIESIRCETRAEWWALEIDLDHEWAENGVRVIAA